MPPERHAVPPASPVGPERSGGPRRPGRYLAAKIHPETERPEEAYDERASFLTVTFITLANLPVEDSDRGVELASMMRLKHHALSAPSATVDAFLDALQEHAIRLKAGLYSAKLS